MPEHGHIKINVDASVCKDYTGIGIVAKDNHGNILAALSQNLPRCSSALAMGGLTVIQGLYLAQ